MKRLVRIARLAALVAAGVLAIALLPRLSGLRAQDILDYTPASPLLAALAILSLHCLKSVVMVIPMVALYLCSGVMFGPVWGLVITYIGLTCELSIGYLLGRCGGQEAISALLGKNRQTARLLNLDADSGPVAVVATRLAPLNYDLGSMLFGSLSMSFPRYLGFSLLGLSPRAVPFVLAGDALDNVFSARFLVPFALCLGVALLVLWLHRRRQVRLLAAAEH